MYFCFGLLGYTISIVSHICIAHIYIYIHKYLGYLAIHLLSSEHRVSFTHAGQAVH